MGRLFDAVASLAGVAQENRFEGQAAMMLECAIGGRRTNEAYPLPDGDWGPLVEALLADLARGAPRDLMAASGFAVYTPQRIPPGDGGIALGQAVLAAGS